LVEATAAAWLAVGEPSLLIAALFVFRFLGALQFLGSEPALASGCLEPTARPAEKPVELAALIECTLAALALIERIDDRVYDFRLLIAHSPALLSAASLPAIKARPFGVPAHANGSGIGSPNV
jgi:hypothetical protein